MPLLAATHWLLLLLLTCLLASCLRVRSSHNSFTSHGREISRNRPNDFLSAELLQQLQRAIEAEFCIPLFSMSTTVIWRQAVGRFSSLLSRYEAATRIICSNDSTEKYILVVIGKNIRFSIGIVEKENYRSLNSCCFMQCNFFVYFECVRYRKI